MRTHAYGEYSKPTLLDRLGIYLSDRTVLSLARQHRPRRILEIGCGYHFPLLRLLEPYAQELHGVDLQTSQEEFSKIKLVRHKIEQDLSFLGNEPFDMIIMISVLEHLSDPQQVLTDIHRLLGSGGLFLINVPTWLGKAGLEFMSFRIGMITPSEIDDHKMYYNKETLWPMLVRAGFKPSCIKLFYRKFGLALFGQARKQ